MQRIIQRAADILDRSPELFRADVRMYELNRRFLWFIVFRFAVVSAFVFLAMTKSFLLPHIAVTSSAFFAMAIFLFAANIIYWWHYRRSAKAVDFEMFGGRLAANVQVQIVLDFIILGCLTYCCGGIESPLVYFFLFHVVISCLFFKKPVSFLNTVLSLVVIFFVSLGPFFGLIPPRHFIFPEAAAGFYDNIIVYSYQLAGVSAVYLIVWFFAASITDSLKRHELRLQDKIGELVKTDKEKTRYMLVTTHELKAPFSSIQSYVNVLLEGYAGEISEKVYEVLWKIKARCQVLTQMITEMLQLANISSLKERKGEVAMDEVELIWIIGTVIWRFKTRMSEKGVKFIWPEGKVYKIMGNAEQLDILFNNVLSNALNYCYANTEIKVEVIEEGGKVSVTVEDKGIGIKKEHLEKVFLEYFRSEAAALINKSSTGLGLPIARQIMEIHGGRIWIESEEKAGTTVFMEFPKRESNGDTSH